MFPHSSADRKDILVPRCSFSIWFWIVCQFHQFSLCHTYHMNQGTQWIFCDVGFGPLAEQTGISVDYEPSPPNSLSPWWDQKFANTRKNTDTGDSFHFNSMNLFCILSNDCWSIQASRFTTCAHFLTDIPFVTHLLSVIRRIISGCTYRTSVIFSWTLRERCCSFVVYSNCLADFKKVV